MRAGWGILPDKKVVGYLGRVSEEKNYRALAQAVRCLPRDWVGVLVGDGTEMPDCQAHAYGTCGTRVYFPGICPPEDVGDVLRAFDVLLVPSHEEGFCQVIVEGWMAGVPVVSTYVGVARDHAEWTWSLSPNPTGNEMAKQIQWATRPWSRSTLHQIAELARKEYGADQMADRWTVLLEQVVRFRNSLCA